jgi:radical SAM superfamily enzyme YgiQ (UPF0313 family)
MRFKLIYPRWPKLLHQTEFHLPPHGPVCFAATVPKDVELTFVDENVDALDLNDSPDLVALSVMLTCQMPRAWEIADAYRARGIKVLFGGISTMLHSDEVQAHADSVFLGEAEGRMGAVIEDFKAGKLKPVYDYLRNPPDIALVGPARRDILNRERYNFRGVQMVDLIHASRGCRFNCFPCCTPFLGGRNFRPRPVEAVVQEMASIPNNRFFIVDNSLAQDGKWEKELFRAIAPLKKKWVSHPILDDDEVLKLAADAGCWYVYQAVAGPTEGIRRRVQRLHDFGIGVEGTILLGLDDQTEDDVKRLVDFLLEMKLDMAEFTVLVPFPHTPVRAQLEREGRILHNDWIRYTGSEVVYRPAKMTPDVLEKMYHYAWESFYREADPSTRMARLFLNVIHKELKDGIDPERGLPKNRVRWGKKDAPQ